VEWYPNLWRYIQMIKLNRTIEYRRLPAELKSYVRELQGVIPFGVYQALAQKLNEGGKEEEYYYRLSEVARSTRLISMRAIPT